MSKKFIEYEVHLEGKISYPFICVKKVIAGSAEEAMKLVKKECNKKTFILPLKINSENGKLSETYIVSAFPEGENNESN